MLLIRIICFNNNTKKRIYVLICIFRIKLKIHLYVVAVPPYSTDTLEFSVLFKL